MVDKDDTMNGNPGDDIDLFGCVETIKDAVAQAYVDPASPDRDRIVGEIGERMAAMSAAEDDEALAERTQSLVRVAENIAISRGLHEAANHFAALGDADSVRFLRDAADLFAHYVVIDIAAAARVTARVQDSTDGKLLARLTEACIDGGCAVGAVH